jgi:ribonuclease P protein component
VKGEQYLTRKAQFQAVYAGGRTYAERHIVLKVLPNELELSRYGLTVSRRVGKAVVRNRIKRRLREIVRRTGLKPGWDFIVIARSPAAQAAFAELAGAVRKGLGRAGIAAGGL